MESISKPLETEKALSAPLPMERKRLVYDSQGPTKEYGGIFAPLLRLEAWMDHKLGVEAEVIERKRPEDRKPLKWYYELDMMFLWASGTMNLSSFATGMLGWQFGLDLKQALICVFFGLLIGCAVTAYCTTFGAATGLRQMSISRYSFGWFPSKLPALLNTIQQIGWSAVGCITGGLALVGVADGGISVIVGIIIIAVVSLFIGLFGIRVILSIQRYAWVVFMIVFLIIIGETGGFADNHTPAKAQGTTPLAGAVLSFLAVVYGWSASWSPIASDYYIVYRADINRGKVFAFSFIGLLLPTCISMWSGALIASALNTHPDWLATYQDHGLGFLLRDMLYPTGFAKFLLVMLVLAGISLNSLSTYSAPISLMQVSPWLGYVPRVFWQVIMFGIVIALGLAGRERLDAYLVNFLDLLGYWCTSYFLILMLEHVVIRKGSFANYDLEGWNDPDRLPHGIAAIIVFLVGVVCWVMGMAETWYIGPLARLFGPHGGDVANEFTLVFTVVTYIPLRYLERRVFGK
ncbi:transmembrane transporter [Malassezia pachydermatis]|uniref:Nucleoside n=1 Tax=Malassezia pachydermatis TaxID=77020 RepID=A0A0M8MH90_9BASI|nr:nucleoside [Malassezia pachydermatis]KOS12406.1 nucleoside [Malassezia pachydermatis]